jgi:peptidoglycan/LPS O-acetylase OafA/YrhL
VKRLPGLDFLRAFAVSWVLLFHFTLQDKKSPLHAIGAYGWMGVDLFFVLSGYLIGNQLFKPIAGGLRPDLRSFVIRRLFRTLPLYFAVLGVYLTFPDWREAKLLAPAWRFLTFTMNLGFSRIDMPAFSHAWSLSVEEQFYLFLPCVTLAIFSLKKPKWTVLATVLSIFIFGLLVRSAIWLELVRPSLPALGYRGLSYYSEYLYYPTYARLDGLLAGVSLALIKNFRPVLWARLLNRKYLTLFFGMLCVGCAMVISNDQMTWLHSALSYPLIALGFALLVITFLSPGFWLSRVRIPGVAGLATLSYALYLTQKLVFHGMSLGLKSWGMDPFGWVGLVLTLAVCIAIAMLAHLGVERPFLRVRDGWVNRCW